MLDEGPIDLEGNLFDTGDVDIKSERVRSTIEMFIWRNGVQIFDKHKAASEEINSDKRKSAASESKICFESGSAQLMGACSRITCICT